METIKDVVIIVAALGIAGLFFSLGLIEQFNLKRKFRKVKHIKGLVGYDLKNFRRRDEEADN